jgi:hypothetical protein
MTRAPAQQGPGSRSWSYVGSRCGVFRGGPAGGAPPRQGVYGRAARGVDLEVQVRAGRVARVARVGDDIASLDRRAGGDLVRGEVAVPGLGAVLGGHDDHVAVGRVPLCAHGAVGRGHHRRAVGDGEVDTGVQRHPVDTGLPVVRAEPVLGDRQRELRPQPLLAGRLGRRLLLLQLLLGLQVDALLRTARPVGEVVRLGGQALQLRVELVVGGGRLHGGGVRLGGRRRLRLAPTDADRGRRDTGYTHDARRRNSHCQQGGTFGRSTAT